MASPADPAEDTYNPDVLGNPAEEMNWDDTETSEPEQRCPASYYFRVLREGSDAATEVDSTTTRCYKVMVDKRINLARFKKCLEPIVGVPVDYFKIYRQYTSQDEEWNRSVDAFFYLVC